MDEKQVEHETALSKRSIAIIVAVFGIFALASLLVSLFMPAR